MAPSLLSSLDMKRFVACLLVLGFFSGCALSDPGDPLPDMDVPDDPKDPVDQEPEPPAVAWSGTYELENRFDLTAAAVLPETVYTYVDVLAGLREDPAGTLFLLLEEANAPILSDLLAIMPSVLEDRLQGWINDYVASAVYEDNSAVDAIDQVLALAQTVLTQFDIMTELEVPSAGTGEQVEAMHRLLALRLRAQGQEVEIPLMPDPALPVLEGEARVLASMVPGADGNQDLMLGEHAFGLAYGTYAYEGLEFLVSQRYGADIRGTLGAIMDCPAMAADVAGKCVLDVCVGHEAELTELCEQGLDLVVDELRTRMHELRFDALALASGEAALVVEASASQTSVVDGVWQAELDVGMGPRALPATFTGSLLP